MLPPPFARPASVVKSCHRTTIENTARCNAQPRRPRRYRPTCRAVVERLSGSAGLRSLSRVPVLDEVGEAFAHALDLRTVHGELTRLGAVPCAELADEHESLQVQDEVVQLAEAAVHAHQAASSSGTAFASTGAVSMWGAGADRMSVAAISAP